MKDLKTIETALMFEITRWPLEVGDPTKEEIEKVVSFLFKNFLPTEKTQILPEGYGGRNPFTGINGFLRYGESPIDLEIGIGIDNNIIISISNLEEYIDSDGEYYPGS